MLIKITAVTKGGKTIEFTDTLANLQKEAKENIPPSDYLAYSLDSVDDVVDIICTDFKTYTYNVKGDSNE